MLDSYENVITNGYHNMSWLYWIYICIEMNLIKFIQLLQSAHNNITVRKRVLVVEDFGENVNM
jgi:hypothetical protein